MGSQLGTLHRELHPELHPDMGGCMGSQKRDLRLAIPFEEENRVCSPLRLGRED